MNKIEKDKSIVTVQKKSNIQKIINSPLKKTTLIFADVTFCIFLILGTLIVYNQLFTRGISIIDCLMLFIGIVFISISVAGFIIYNE